MKPGLVVTIRVNPVDCQSILALLDSSGFERGNQTFSSMVSLTLSGMLQSCRDSGQIKIPDPFKYWDDVGQYHKTKHAEKEAVAKMIHTLMGKGIAARAEEANVNIPDVPTAEQEQEMIKALPGKIRRAGIRLKELLIKKEHARDSWSGGDQVEYDQLYKIVYPDG